MKYGFTKALILLAIERPAYLEDTGSNYINKGVQIDGDIEEIGNGLVLSHPFSSSRKQNPKTSEDLEITYAHRIDFPNVSKQMFSPKLGLNMALNDHNLSFRVSTASYDATKSPISEL